MGRSPVLGKVGLSMAIDGVLGDMTAEDIFESRAAQDSGGDAFCRSAQRDLRG